MPCCDDPDCECNNPTCAQCGQLLFGWEDGPECALCEDQPDFGPDDVGPEYDEIAAAAINLAREGDEVSNHHWSTVYRDDGTNAGLQRCMRCGKTVSVPRPPQRRDCPGVWPRAATTPPQAKETK
jgi:hypothetical protein